MSHDREPVDPHLRLLRLIATGVVLTITAIYLLAGIINIPFVRIDFKPDQITLGSLFGALFVLLGLLAAPRWPRGRD
jgi:hypothetical protein